MKIYSATNREKSDFEIIQNILGKDFWLETRLAGRSSRISWIRIINYDIYEIVTTNEQEILVGFNKLEESPFGGFLDYYNLANQMSEEYRMTLEDITIIQPLALLTTDEIIELYNEGMQGS